jgi:multicomponent Na+:H+ antiporter subunit D
VATHKTEVSQMRGLGRTMPLTMGAFFVASLSIIGLPPMGGLWSKWFLAMAALEAEQVVLVGVLMVSSLLNIAYLLPIPIRGFFSASEGEPPAAGIREAPPTCVAALVLTALGCLVLFFHPQPIYRLLTLIVP